MAKNKAQFLNQIVALLKKRYKLEPAGPRLSVLEATVYAICHEGSTREQANQALSRFKDAFFDWNEVRVSSVDEIQGVLAGAPQPEDRAFRIRRFLRQLFEKTYGFTLDQLPKKTLKEAVKSLKEYEAFSAPYVLATVIQHSLGGHAIGVDAPARRALERLGVADPATSPEALQGTLDRAIPKNRGIEFVDLMAELTHDVCVEGTPKCPRCELRKICPTGLARKQEWSGKAAAPSKDGTKGAAAASKDGAKGPSKDGTKKGKKPKSSHGKSPRPK